MTATAQMTKTTEVIKPEPVAESTNQFIRILDEGKKSSSKHDIFMVECPPQPVMATIGGTQYRLELPWVYYVITISERSKNKYATGAAGNSFAYSRVSTVYARTCKLTGNSSPLYFMPLPNLYPTSRTFCANSGPVTTEDKYGRLNQAISSFWDSNFSYMVPRTEPEVWKKMAKLANTTVSGTAHHSYEMGPLYKWWESLSAEEVLKLPWGKKKWGTLEEVIVGKYYGYDSYA
jgi:hypothetical protein